MKYDKYLRRAVDSGVREGKTIDTDQVEVVKSYDRACTFCGLALIE